MLVIRSQGKNIKIPSEFCLIDGVPSEIRNSSQHWRKCLAKISQKPQEKMRSLEKLMQTLNNMKKWKDFDIQLDSNPEILESRRLDIPELEHNEGSGQRLFCNERLLKQMPVYNSKTLSNKKMILLYNHKNSRSVNDVMNGLLKCQSQLNLKTQNIEPFEVPMANDKYLEKRIFELLG